MGITALVFAIASRGIVLGSPSPSRSLRSPALLAVDALATTGIINGSVVHAPLDKYSYFALPTVGTNNEWLGCGASIISPTFALTSAHCFGGGSNPCSEARKVSVWVGDVTLKYGFYVEGKEDKGARHFHAEAEVICSQDFDGKCSHGNDITLLKLKEAVPSWVKPVALNLHGSSMDAPGSLVRSMGFGVTESASDPRRLGDVATGLREVSVHVLDNAAENCQRLYANGWGCSDLSSEREGTNIDHQICAGAESKETERDTCSGDSGSPMIDSKGVQVGIVSYGGGPGDKQSGAGRACGDRDYPGIYARVSAFASFLLKNVDDLPKQLQHESHA